MISDDFKLIIFAPGAADDFKRMISDDFKLIIFAPGAADDFKRMILNLSFLRPAQRMILNLS